jgi:hypothetical protein
MPHLDKWVYYNDLYKDPIENQNFIWKSLKSKNVYYKVELSVFLLN